MRKFFKKFCSAENFCIMFLTVLVVSVGYLAIFKGNFNISTSTKNNTNSKVLSGYSYDTSYKENYYRTDYNKVTHTNSNSVVQNSNNNYNGNYSYDTNPPAIEWQPVITLTKNKKFNPMDWVKAHHKVYGDVTDIIQVVYNNVDTSVPGTYTVVYKACNYPGSTYCRTASSRVTVSGADNYGNTLRSPKWENKDDVSCLQGSTKCDTYNVDKPKAIDPTTYKYLYVRLVSGTVNIYQPGTYVLIYQAETEQGVVGTIAKKVIIQEKNTTSNTVTLPTQKYVEKHTSQYYDDGMYRGYLNENTHKIYINNHKWTNVVTYTFKCVNKGQYGSKGWALVSTDKSNGVYSNNADNHPTYYYNVNGYYGYLNKTSFYLSDPQDKLDHDLGLCTYLGTTKQVNRTWVGLYSGYVYLGSTTPTYSGYVYLYK